MIRPEDIDKLRKQLADHWEAGVTFRNEGLGLRSHDNARSWKEKELQWAVRLYDIVDGIDPADVAKVRTLNWIDILILPENHPLADDSENSLREHNTRLNRVDDLMTEYRTRFGPVSVGTESALRGLGVGDQETRKAATRERGEPKPRTIVRWKADHDDVVERMELHECGPTKAAKLLHVPGKRSADAIGRNYRRYKQHLANAAKRQNGKNSRQ